MNQKNIKGKVKKYFFDNPTTKLRVREVEQTINVPLPSAIRYCKELEQEKIFKTEIIGKTKFYTTNKTSFEFTLEKKLYNIRTIYESGLIEHLKKELSNPVIILFGSYSRGEDIETSDIDLYVETESKKELELKKFEKKLKRKIQIFKHKSIKSVRNPHLMNNIINGIKLNNQIEVFK